MALYDAAEEAGGIPVAVYQHRKTQLDFADDAVYAAIASEPDVIISISGEKMGNDRRGILELYGEETKYDNLFHYLLYGAKKLRAFWSPSVTREMFARTVPVDYSRMKREATALKEILDRAVSVRMTNPKGSDITIGISGRSAKADDGDFSEQGSGGNLPAGETFISPVVGSSEGSIVFDGSISSHAGVIVIREPIVVKVVNGFVTEVNGGMEAEALRESLRLGELNAFEFEKTGKLRQGMAAVYSRNARNIGELGIGLNPEARITGNMLEDEKAYRTCHIAIGKNYDEDAPALIHLDGLITEPTLRALMDDGKEVVLMENGSILV